MKKIPVLGWIIGVLIVVLIIRSNQKDSSNNSYQKNTYSSALEFMSDLRDFLKNKTKNKVWNSTRFNNFLNSEEWTLTRGSLNENTDMGMALISAVKCAQCLSKNRSVNSDCVEYQNHMEELLRHSDPHNFKHSNCGVLFFCMESSRMNGLVPQRKVLYSLNGMQTMQKIKGGYLMRPADLYSNGYDIIRPVFVYFDQELSQDEILGVSPGGPFFSAYYDGDIKYETISGFTKNTYVFRVLPSRNSIHTPLPRDKN